ncbi:MAG: transglutaminase domain-containing protein [Armatimonadetes bacterium]|nr:transglutaminase domain-containing protein [Armatimonadota bacterium]
MSSVQANDYLTKRDEAPLYGATAIAVAAALFAAGGGRGSVRVGLIAAALGSAGVFLGWHTRSWSLPRRLLLGLAAGGAAAVALQGIIDWEIEVEASGIYQARGDIALGLGLQMAVLLVAFSYVLVLREMLPFSLVPGLATFGLVGSRGDETIVLASFVLFLPAALVSVAQATLLSGLPAEGRAEHHQWQLRDWRTRHWMTLGVITATIMLLAYALFLPVTAYGTQYHWPLQMMLSSDGFSPFPGMGRSSEPSQSYAVGRGPVTLTETPMFSVQGPAAELWRGEVFDIYTGGAWLKDESASSLAWTTGDVIDLQGLVALNPDAPVVTHTITAEQDIPLVFHSAGQIQRVTLGQGIPKQSQEGFRVDKYGCLILPAGTLKRGAGYEVVSEVPAAVHGRLTSSRVASPALSDSANEPYLRVPLSSRRVADLARQVAGDADSPTEKLSALVSYIQQNCVYSLDAPPVPRGEDAVDYFLFRQKRGYCDMFATSLAVMARAVGIPTRFVLGYAGGEYDSEGDRYIIRDSDYHAWVEAYIAPWGWVNVDATPGGDLPPIPPLRRVLLWARFRLQDHPFGAAGLAAAVLGPLLLAVVLMRRAARLSLSARAKRDSRAAVVWAYDQLCRLLLRLGRPRLPSQTPLEFLASLESAPATRPRAKRAVLPPDSLPPARGLTEIFLRARYGPGPVTEQTAHLALQRLLEVRQAFRSRGTRPPA